MALEDDIGVLARNPTLAALEPEALRLIAFAAEMKTLRAGDVLFRRDELANDGFVVLAGSVAVDPSGLGAATARIVRPPGLIGDIALITQTRRPATRARGTIALDIERVVTHFVTSDANSFRRERSSLPLAFLGSFSTESSMSFPGAPRGSGKPSVTGCFVSRRNSVRCAVTA